MHLSMFQVSRMSCSNFHHRFYFLKLIHSENARLIFRIESKTYPECDLQFRCVVSEAVLKYFELNFLKPIRIPLVLL